MGAWGAGLFDDDLACDVQAEYRQAISEGLDPPATRDRVLERFAEALSDPDEAPVVWLSLAATAWDMGRLDDCTRDRALTIIIQRQGMGRWIEAGLERKRAAILVKLADRLCRPQKPPVTAKKKRGFVSSWAVGEIVGYRQETGLWLALHVVGHSSGEVGSLPIVMLLDWTSDTAPPSEADLAGVTQVLFPPEWDMSLPKRSTLCLLITRRMERDSFVRWGLHQQPQAVKLFDETDLSYVGPTLFERDLIGLWRADRG